MRIVRSIIRSAWMEKIKQEEKLFDNFTPFQKAKEHIQKRKKELSNKVKICYDILGFMFKDVYYFDATFHHKEIIHIIKMNTLLFDFKETYYLQAPSTVIRNSIINTMANIIIFGLRNYFASLYTACHITVTEEAFTLQKEDIKNTTFPLKTILPIRYILVKLDDCEGEKEYVTFDTTFQKEFTELESKYLSEVQHAHPHFSLDWESFIAPDTIEEKIVATKLDGKGVHLHLDQFFGKDKDPVHAIQHNPKMLASFADRLIRMYRIPMTPVTHIYIIALFNKWANQEKQKCIERYQALLQWSEKEDISTKKEYVEMVVLKELLKLKKVAV